MSTAENPISSKFIHSLIYLFIYVSLFIMLIYLLIYLFIYAHVVCLLAMIVYLVSVRFGFIYSTIVKKIVHFKLDLHIQY